MVIPFMLRLTVYESGVRNNAVVFSAHPVMEKDRNEL